MAQLAMEMGFYISFSGIVTFKSAKDLQATCKAVPLDRMLIETDSPYLAPIPYRGKINEPAWVAKVGEFVANLKGVAVEELAKRTSSNFYECFHIDRNHS
jgi:TatD DNase family protein